MKDSHIVILGAGIGGVETYKSLVAASKKQQLPVRITIVDQNQYFVFTPMLHEVAAGSVAPEHCIARIREIIKPPHTFLRATVISIDPKKKQIKTSEGNICYDYCVVALGSGVNYFGTPNAETHTFNVRTLPHALALKQAVQQKILHAKEEGDIAIVGGGYTGIELAGQFHSLLCALKGKHYIKKGMTIHLIDGNPNILGQLPSTIQEAVTNRLKKLHIHLHLGKKVGSVTSDAVILDNGEKIKSNITIWCGGVKNIAPHILTEAYCEFGRIPVNEYLQHKQDMALYAIGDIACITQGATTVPQLGQAAKREGNYAGKHIIASITKKKIAPFRFIMRGMFIPVGNWWAAASVGRFTITGKFPWWLRRTVYLMFLPQWRQKLGIVIDWTLHSARLKSFIIEPVVLVEPAPISYDTHTAKTNKP